MCGCRTDGRLGERMPWESMRYGVPATLRDVTIGGWSPSNGRARIEAQNLVVAWPPRRPFLVLVGGYGLGKSHLAAGVLRAAYEQHNIRGQFLSMPAFMDRLRDAQSETTEETPEGLQRWLEGLPLVVMDDLGKDKQTEWVSGRLYRAINHRYGAGLPTVITINPEEWGGLDGAVRSRLMDTRTSVVVEIQGRDRRTTGGAA